MKPIDPHQLHALNKAVSTDCLGIFFEQRGGKTRVAIDYIGICALRGVAHKVLVATTLSAMDEMIQQFDYYLPAGMPRTLHVYKNPTSLKKALDKRKQDELFVVLVNHEKLTKAIRPVLEKVKFDTLVVDESHKLKDPSGTRSKVMWYIARKIERKLLLTGTPTAKRPLDIFAQFRILDERIFGSAYGQFRERFAYVDTSKGFPQIMGYKNLHILEKMIKKHSVRVLRKDIFNEEPPEMIEVRVPLDNREWDIYKRLRDNSVYELENGINVVETPAQRIMYLQMLTGGFPTGCETAVVTSKFEKLMEVVQSHTDFGEPVIIFHRFTEEGHEICRRLKRAGLNYATYNGQTSEQDRLKAKKDFQDGNLDALVMQVSTGITGATLDRAYVNIFFSMSFSVSDFQQARDRVAGRNQTRRIKNYFILADKTVDVKVLKTLQNDEDVSRSVTDNWRWFLKEDDE